VSCRFVRQPAHALAKLAVELIEDLGLHDAVVNDGAEFGNSGRVAARDLAHDVLEEGHVEDAPNARLFVAHAGEQHTRDRLVAHESQRILDGDALHVRDNGFGEAKAALGWRHVVRLVADCVPRDVSLVVEYFLFSSHCCCACGCVV